MRTTLNLPDHLFRGAKALAAQEGRTVTSIVEEALRRFLETHSEAPERRAGLDRHLPSQLVAALAAQDKPYRARPLAGHGPLPDELICDNSALLDRLDGFDAAADS